MSYCKSCGGLIGRDCFNPVECEQISNYTEEETTQSSTLLCIEEKAIDEMIESYEKEIQEVDYTDFQNAIDYGNIKAYVDILKELKSKMKPIADIRSEAWDKSQEATIESFIHSNSRLFVREAKTKYINGEK